MLIHELDNIDSERRLDSQTTNQIFQNLKLERKLVISSDDKGSKPTRFKAVRGEQKLTRSYYEYLNPFEASETPSFKVESKSFSPFRASKFKLQKDNVQNTQNAKVQTLPVTLPLSNSESNLDVRESRDVSSQRKEVTLPTSNNDSKSCLQSSMLHKKVEIEPEAKRKAVTNKVTQINLETDVSNSQRAGSKLDQQKITLPGQF